MSKNVRPLTTRPRCSFRFPNCKDQTGFFCFSCVPDCIRHANQRSPFNITWPVWDWHSYWQFGQTGKENNYLILTTAFLVRPWQGNIKRNTNQTWPKLPFIQRTHLIHTGNFKISTSQPAIDELSQYKSIVSCKCDPLAICCITELVPPR